MAGVLINTIKAELLKNRHSKIIWVTFVAFSLAPLMGAVFILMVQSPGAMDNAGTLNAKVQMMNFTASWASYIGILCQAIGVGGVLIFGFVASWIFGREYSDGTAKDLLALPTPRTTIIHAKFIVYLLWCSGLALSNLLVGFVLGLLLQLPAPTESEVYSGLATYGITALLTFVLGTPIAFFAIWGKGYLTPLGFVALTLVFAQVVAAAGYGYYFPWSVPGLYSGAGGSLDIHLIQISYIIVICTGITGYIATAAYWKYANHTK